MQSCYHEYVNHMLRQFFARDNDFSPGSVAEKNRAACQNVFDQIYADQFEILRDIFSQPDQQIAPLVRICAENHHIKEVRVWKTIRDVSKKIARERGLIDQEGRE